MQKAGFFIPMDCSRRMPPNSLIFVNISAYLWQECDAACR
jgi:hypothetical protein